jgi:hypothetical protein
MGNGWLRRGFPRPSWPHMASPQVYTRPYTESAATCAAPVVTSAIGVLCSADT